MSSCSAPHDVPESREVCDGQHVLAVLEHVHDLAPPRPHIPLNVEKLLYVVSVWAAGRACVCVCVNAGAKRKGERRRGYGGTAENGAKGRKAKGGDRCMRERHTSRVLVYVCGLV